MKTYGKYSTQDIMSKIDHTLLSRTATKEQIEKLCDEALKYGTASVCIPSAYIEYARKYAGERLCICTVIGFPNGYSTVESKCFEAADAVAKGADEVDMVINTNALKNGEWDYLLDEINAIKKACAGKLLKVIVETCLLTEDEKKRISEVVSRSDAEYIKTSTGFSTHGATHDDVKILVDYCPGKKVKAAGGIKTIDDAVDFMELGAERLGTSSLLSMLVEDAGL